MSDDRLITLLEDENKLLKEMVSAGNEVIEIQRKLIIALENKTEILK